MFMLHRHNKVKQRHIERRMAPPSKRHVAIFPFMAQGHTLPLLDLSKALASQDIKVTIVTTPVNAEAILIRVSKHPNISVAELPFPNDAVSGLPKGCENTSQLSSFALHSTFLFATEHLAKPFERLLQSMKDSQTLPLCVVSDFFLGFTLQICNGFGVPRLVFHGMGVLSMAISKAAWTHRSHLGKGGDDDVINLPGLKLPFALTFSDLPLEVVNASDAENPLTRFIGEIGEADANSWGVIANTCRGLDAEYTSFFESFYTGGARTWCVGPLCLYDDDDDYRPSDDVMTWLDGQDPGTVIYLSFGSQSDVSDAQLDEVAYGLAESGESFVWVVRSKTWAPPSDVEPRLHGKGLVVPGWVDQRGILSHGSVGGFLSHCGWNSVLESLSSSVPMLTWPLFAEQGLNSRLVVDGLGAGIRVGKPLGGGTVSRGAICRGVRELMAGERGQVARDKAAVLRAGALQAVGEGGSSRETLRELVATLRG